MVGTIVMTMVALGFAAVGPQLVNRAGDYLDAHARTALRAWSRRSGR